MGIAAPFYGYVTPSETYAEGGATSSIASGRGVAAIEEFCSIIEHGPARSILDKMKYPSHKRLHLASMEIETDLIRRPVLQRLLNTRKSGSIVVHYRSDLYVQGSGQNSTDEERKHAGLLNDFIDGMAPVISLFDTHDDPKIKLTAQLQLALRTRDYDQIYMLIADNYADNRQKIESHVKKMLAKPHAEVPATDTKD